MFSKVLIANRGLIQANCVRAVQELNAKAITIFENEDRNSAGVRNADEAVEIKSASTSRAYADIDQIVELASSLNVDAVHSGYGFLAQNAEFSKKLKQKGIVPIAPELEGAFNLANRPLIKRKAKELGLHVLPGSKSCSTYKSLEESVEAIGYPLLIKAVYGYGGKGIRVVRAPEELKASYDYVLSRCEKFSMNSTDVIIEKFFDDAHHIEFPILRDNNGHVIVFPEQWCSVQRRFQKLLVETPSRVISNEKRNKLRSIIRLLADKLNLLGFGSFVFLVDGDFCYFLKVNGYIQPFYTATSFLTGIDLLKEQIRVFSGESLRAKPEHLNRYGHVISVSIAAEDPNRDFSPCPGTIDRFYLPFGQGINVQTNVFSGDNVATFYDPMIAKIIVRDFSRRAAINKMKVALDNSFIDGISTNIPLMRAIVHSEEFLSRKMNISFISKRENRLKIMRDMQTSEEQEIASLVAALALHNDRNNQQILEAAREIAPSPIWSTATRWFNRKQ